MVKPASISRYSLSLAGLALLCASQPAFAQSKPAAADDKPESEEAVFIPIEYRPPPYRVAVGVRLAGNTKVKFSGLGSIINSSSPPPDPDKDGNWQSGNWSYDTWDSSSGLNYVYKDRSADSEGNAITVSDGKTNFWSFTSTEQIVTDPNYAAGEAIKYQTNWITSNGASISSESGKSLAWDIEISRELGGNKRFSWGLLFGAGLSDFKQQHSATVQATLHTVTDYYSLGGEYVPRIMTPNADGTDVIYVPSPYTSPGPKLYIQALNSDNTTLKFNDNGTPYFVQYTGYEVYPTGVTPATKWYDGSIRLADHPYDRVYSDTPGVDVEGTWKVRGSFLTARFGPFFAANLGRHFTVRASAGLTFTVLGARMSFQEKYFHPVLKTYLSIDTDQPINESSVTGTMGYFATGELEWHMTQRTGIFVAASYEDYLRKMKIQIGQQIAEIEASTGTALRAGVSARF